MPETADTPDIRHLPSLLRLLDDDSPKVRDKIWDLISANVSAWEAPLRERLASLAGGSRKRLQELLDAREKERFRETWIRWRDLPEELDKLESALASLSDFLARQAGENPGGGPGVPELLDRLARDFRASGELVIPSRLARFLFHAKALRGADTDYYHPRNSDLAHVLRQRRGIPITLACIFMLVGRRVGLDIRGCDVPEHFLTRAEEGGEAVIIDCYDSGRVLGRDRLLQLEKKYAPDFNRLLKTRASAESIVARVLRNLINAFHLAGDKESSEYVWTLAEDLRGERDRIP